MAATLKTDVVGNKTDTTANLTLGSSGATTFGGAVTIASGTINGTTIGASTATTADFTNVVATEIKATSGQTLSLKEDSGTAVITVDTSGNVVVNPATSSGTISVGSIATQSVVQDAKIAGTGFESGATSAGVGLGVGKVYVGITGEIKMFAGASEPEGWVFCDGSAYDGSASGAYNNLYDVISTTYGNGGGGSNMFNVPDMRGRVPAGMDDMDGSAGTGGGNAGRLTSGTLGATGGNATETIATQHLPSHTHHNSHGHTDDLHLASGNAALNIPQSTGTGSSVPAFANFDVQTRLSSGMDTQQTNTTLTFTSTDAVGTTLGGGVANYTGDTEDIVETHETTSLPNLQPYLCVNYIIKL